MLDERVKSSLLIPFPSQLVLYVCGAGGILFIITCAYAMLLLASVQPSHCALRVLNFNLLVPLLISVANMALVSPPTILKFIEASRGGGAWK